MTAIFLARKGFNDITILEKNEKIGRKILATGNGRCNFTNLNISPQNFHSNYKQNFFNPISNFGSTDTIKFFNSLGIVELIENNKVFPASEQASSILDVLRLEMDRLRINVITNININNIEYKNGMFTLYSKTQNHENQKTFVSNASKAQNNDGQKTFVSNKVIIATGGLAGGHTGEIYKILEKLGHKIEALKPTLVHIKSTSAYCKMLQGTRIKAKVTTNSQREEYGEVLFTEDGLSGPAIFNVSRDFATSKADELALDLAHKQNIENVIGMIYNRITNNPHYNLEELFLGWLNKKVGIAIVKYSNIGKLNRPVNTLEYSEVETLAQTIKAFSFKITGTRPFKFAQATVGGVSLADINLNSMQSKKIPGLYFTGEVLDVDGDCGGYNLQWAWSCAATLAQNIDK
ncbi:MAG: hypothetical protein ATN31_03730 [Candidatus Epulonipiscioides saccharophilum]|nr:MAG: hypothetical protein ATN31_03730 [Epulopiscium sp. AS2M-Bin001]